MWLSAPTLTLFRKLYSVFKVQCIILSIVTKTYLWLKTNFTCARYWQNTL